jgi:hypothetical protein
MNANYFFWNTGEMTFAQVIDDIGDEVVSCGRYQFLARYRQFRDLYKV